jgi:hypothetical protein
MSHILQLLKTRLSGRSDSEHVQDLIRIVITALFITYLGWRYLFLKSDDTLLLTWLILVGELLVAVALLVAIMMRPGISPVRRWIGDVDRLFGHGRDHVHPGRSDFAVVCRVPVGDHRQRHALWPRVPACRNGPWLRLRSWESS